MSEIIEYEKHISEIAPLGLPPAFSIKLTQGESTYYNFVVVSILDQRRRLVESAKVEFHKNGNHTFDGILKKVREAAVEAFNDYIVSMKDDDILKSIEDRLNANREMLVLESRPGPAVDDTSGEWYGVYDGGGYARKFWETKYWLSVDPTSSDRQDS